MVSEKFIKIWSLFSTDLTIDKIVKGTAQIPDLHKIRNKYIKLF